MLDRDAWLFAFAGVFFLGNGKEIPNYKLSNLLRQKSDFCGQFKIKDPKEEIDVMCVMKKDAVRDKAI